MTMQTILIPYRIPIYFLQKKIVVASSKRLFIFYLPSKSTYSYELSHHFADNKHCICLQIQKV